MGIRTQRKKLKEKMMLPSILAPDHVACEDDTYDWLEPEDAEPYCDEISAEE